MTNTALIAQLKEAEQIVRSAELPECLQAIAFEKALDALLANDDSPNRLGNVSDGTTDLQGSDWMSALHEATNVPIDKLQDIYVSDESGYPLVTLDSSRLGKNKAERARKVVLLVVGARQVGTLESATDSSEIIEACKRLDVHDSANFGTTLGKMSDWFHILGTGRSRNVQIKPSGRNALRDLLEALGSRN